MNQAVAVATPATPAPTVASQSYASLVNAQFDNVQSHFVNLKQRWDLTLEAMPLIQRNQVRSALKVALNNFRKRHPGVKSFQDPNFRLCKAQSLELGRILIDTTMQRQLNVYWVIKIIDEFSAWRAWPIQVYRVLNNQGELADHDLQELYASWDGQHTAMALYLIATMEMGLDAAETFVPVVIYDVNSKSEIRENFIKGNSPEGKKLLDPIDFWYQMVYGVKCDDNQNPEWQQVAAKQALLTQYDLFVTDDKLQNTHEIGAITRVKDLMDSKVTVEQMRQLCVYLRHVLDRTPRPVNTKELPIILGFLRMATYLRYSDDQIRGLADLCLDLFDGDFDEAGPYWDRVGRAYLNWWDRHYENVDVSLRPAQPRLNKDWMQGGAFFWHQLRKSWRDSDGNPVTMPQLSIATQFMPSREDLF